MRGYTLPGLAVLVAIGLGIYVYAHSVAGAARPSPPSGGIAPANAAGFMAAGATEGPAGRGAAPLSPSPTQEARP